MFHKDPDTDLARIVGFEVTPNRFFFSSSFALYKSFVLIL